MKVEIRPAFDEAVIAAELPIRKGAAKMLLLIQSLDLLQLRTHPGLNFEKLHGMIEPGTGEQLYSLRVTGSARAIACLTNCPAVVLVSLHIGYFEKFEFSFEIKACEKFYRRHIVDIPRIKF